MPGVEEIVSRIEHQLTPGAIVLVHDGGGDRQQTVEAMRVLIPRLLAAGWTFDVPEVTVEALPADVPASAAPSPTLQPESAELPTPLPSDPAPPATPEPTAEPTPVPTPVPSQT